MKKSILVLSVILMTVCASAQEKKRWAIVELSSIYMRSAPKYTASLETQELMGTVVEIVNSQSYWREIKCPQPYQAWCTSMGIVEKTQEEIDAYNKAPKYMYAGILGHVYTKPEFESEVLCDLVGGDLLRIGQINEDGWTEVILPSEKKGWVYSSFLKPHNGFTSIPMGKGNAESVSDVAMEGIIETAISLMGVPYLWGGMTPKGVDCSGLVRWAYLMNGFLLPRNASQIVKCGETVTDKSQLKRGDLIFFGRAATAESPLRVTHVGIYLGDNKFIHSSHMIRVNSLNPDDPDYYSNAKNLVAIRRL